MKDSEYAAAAANKSPIGFLHLMNLMMTLETIGGGGRG
jgi:hypothetical protein